MPRKIYPWEFWAIPKYVAEDKKLKDLDKLIVGIFVTRWNGENDVEIPAKQETLAKQLGKKPRDIRRSLDRLYAEGYLKATGRNLGKKLANKYKLKI